MASPAEEIVGRLEAIGLKIIPRWGRIAAIRGQFGPEQNEMLDELRPALNDHEPEIVALLAEAEAGRGADRRG